MTSERLQRQVDRLLDEAEEALRERDWSTVHDRAEDALRLDPENIDAKSFLDAAKRGPSGASSAAEPSLTSTPQPTSFADGRYKVSKFLGEGGKKKVYLAHDETLDRDVAFALIKTDGLDEESRTRVSREAQAMGRLGANPYIVTVLDFGEEGDQPCMVTEFMDGGDVEGLIEDAPDHRVPMEQALKIARETCLGLEFVHSKGIVHRDLKPGNIWLLGDGTAKIGDFGLAVSTDRSRLTQEGMMVGTATYMPPEQALGGEVTAQSDLYSLGAMLYELVTGRPPFIGDESVAIITQHLNTPPVSPTWHNPAISPGLETLIMRLLEKDASKRPASAAEVSQALQAIGAGVVAVAADAEVPTGPDPVYRRTFVGRETELTKLKGIFDGAISGNGALVMVVGEPGIGKTSITEQLATYVAMRGGKTLVGHCYEEGSLSLPYLAFVESIRSYVLSREPDDLKSELGTGAGEVARIVSEIRDRVQVELPTAGDPEEDRYRLLQAVTGFLRSASSVNPLMVVLEDLHDADRGTLDMLTHVARNLSGTRLLIIGTYRDVEVDRAHPLSAALAELRRIDSFDRVPLRGLTIDEVQRMVNSVFGHERAPRELAETIHRQTEGNPLFVQEVLRYFVEEGLMERDGSQLRRVGEEGLADKVPEGLRDVIGRRLTKLSPEAEQILSIAAVVGREFRLDVLQKVSTSTEDDLYGALEEATNASVIEERSGVGSGITFRFTHAFFRQTLYEEMFAPRRIQAHHLVARALETVHADRLSEHAVELAEHFVQSTDAEDLTKALQYSEMAAGRSMSVYAYGEAEHHLEQALKVQEVLDPDGSSKRCSLLLALCDAMLPAEDPGRVADRVAPEAFTLAEGLGDATMAARASVLAYQAMQRGVTDVGARFSPERINQFSQWADRADRYAASGTVDRVYADVYKGLSGIQVGDPVAGHVWLRQALESARQVDDARAFFITARWAYARLNALQDHDAVYRLAEEFTVRPRHGVNATSLAECLPAAGLTFLQMGDRTRAEECFKELRELADRNLDASLEFRADETQLVTELLEGRLVNSIDQWVTLVSRAEQLGISISADFSMSGIRSLHHLGRYEEILATVEGNPNRAADSIRVLALAHLGRLEEASTIRERFPDIGSDEDESAAIILLSLLEGAVLCHDHATAAQLFRRLTMLAPDSMLRLGYNNPARVLGDAATFLGKPEQARELYNTGLETCAKIGFRPEIALINLGLAELLLDHYPDERTDALEHLDFAIAEFQEMKMQPSLERALRHRDILKA